MWSLANEFWYYVVFPLAARIVLVRSTALVRSAALCILFLLFIALPMWLLAGGIIWVAGAAAAWCTRREELARCLRHLTTRIVAMPLLFAALILTKALPNQIDDLELGMAVALTLPVLAALPSPGGSYKTLARASSEVSYTLYLTHFPLLTFIIMVYYAPHRASPSLYAAGLYAVLLSVALIWAAVVWWCFERNTNRAYSVIASILLAPRRRFRRGEPG